MDIREEVTDGDLDERGLRERVEKRDGVREKVADWERDGEAEGDVE